MYNFLASQAIKSLEPIIIYCDKGKILSLTCIKLILIAEILFVVADGSKESMITPCSSPEGCSHSLYVAQRSLIKSHGDHMLIMRLPDDISTSAKTTIAKVQT